jgi:gas vesicle protein
MTDNRSSLFFYGFGLGVVGALLLAPQSGAKTRRAIVDNAKQGRDFVERQSSKIRDSVSGAIERGAKAAKGATQNIADVFEAGKRAVRG